MTQVGALLDGLIPLVGGITATLSGFGVIGNRRNPDIRHEQWRARSGPTLRIAGPFLIVFGLWRLGSAYVGSGQPPPSASPPEPISKSSIFLPAKVGTTWTYQAGGSQVAVRVTTIEPVQGKDCVRRETSIDGKVVNTEHIRPEQDAIMKYDINGGLYIPPFPLVYDTAQAPVKWQYVSGNGKMSYECEQTEGGPVQVPLGRYERTILVTMKGSDRSGESTLKCWYAEGVGLIREYEKSPTFEVLLELKSFSQPP